MCLFVHPWDMEMGGRYSKFWLPWLVGMPAETATAIVSLLMGGVLERFPRLRICFAHGGGAFPFTVGRINHGYRRVSRLSTLGFSLYEAVCTVSYFTLLSTSVLVTAAWFDQQCQLSEQDNGRTLLGLAPQPRPQTG